MHRSWADYNSLFVGILAGFCRQLCADFTKTGSGVEELLSGNFCHTTIDKGLKSYS